MAVALLHRGLNMGLVSGVPKINPTEFLHGEESLEIFKPLEAGTTVVIQQEVIDVQDKTKGERKAAVIVF